MFNYCPAYGTINYAHGTVKCQPYFTAGGTVVSGKIITVQRDRDMRLEWAKIGIV